MPILHVFLDNAHFIYGTLAGLVFMLGIGRGLSFFLGINLQRLKTNKHYGTSCIFLYHVRDFYFRVNHINSCRLEKRSMGMFQDFYRIVYPDVCERIVVAVFVI